MKRSGKLTLLALLFGLGAVVTILLARRTRPTASTNDPECRLTVPHSTVDPMVFPTKSGSEALDAAIIGNADAEVIRRVIAEQGGQRVLYGTRCSSVEVGSVYSRVLVTDGPLVGKTVWAPSVHVRGE